MKSFIIAEIASNWEGSIAKATKLIHEAKKAGADAVKFQMWRANDLYNDTHPSWKFIKKSELTIEKTRKLKTIADKARIEFFCSAFYPDAITFLEKLKVKRYKVASRTCLLNDPFSLETLHEKATTRKPVIISMGMGGNRKKIEKIFSKNLTTFCYCVSEYPTPMNKIDWANAKRQGVKKIIIEKHVKLKNSNGPDASSSIDTSEFIQMISAIRMIEKLKFKN